MSNSWKAPIGKHWGNGFVAEEKEREKKLPNQAVVPTPSTDATQNNVFAPYYESMRDDAKEQYKSDLAALKRNKNVQMQEAAINNELLKKYLPQMNQMSGLSGLGVSESANIDALSRYQNTVSGIEQGYTQGKSELDRYLRSDLADINAAERAEQREDQQLLDLYKREDQSEAYQMASMQIMGATSASEIDAILTAWEGKTNEDQYNNLVAYAKSRKTSLTEVEKEVEDSMGSTAVSGTVDNSGGTVKIPIPTQDGVGLKLDLSILGETDFQEAIDAGAKRENGEVFVYDKAIYYKKNDRVYELVDPEGNNNSEVYSAIYGYLNDGEMIPVADPIKKFFDEAKAERDKSKAEKPKTGEQKRDEATRHLLDNYSPSPTEASGANGRATSYNGRGGVTVLMPDKTTKYYKLYHSDTSLDKVPEDVVVNLVGKNYVKHDNITYELR